MARQEFIDQLKTLGYAVENLDGDRIAFPYVPRTGKFRGQQLTLGFAVSDDFPANCPSGSHVKPRLLPMKADGDKHPHDRIHESPFGGEWQYWSRPFPNWNGTAKTAKVYMEHIDRLFDQ
jgi:hypothetical protein